MKSLAPVSCDGRSTHDVRVALLRGRLNGWHRPGDPHGHYKLSRCPQRVNCATIIPQEPCNVWFLASLGSALRCRRSTRAVHGEEVMPGTRAAVEDQCASNASSAVGCKQDDRRHPNDTPLGNGHRLPIRLTGKAALPRRCWHPGRATRGTAPFRLNGTVREQFEPRGTLARFRIDPDRASALAAMPEQLAH